MFTTPFSFMAAPAGGGGWTPADFTNLYEWWTSDSGVAVSSGQVDSWTGYTGKILSPYNLTYKAAYTSSDSDWGGQPSILLNPTWNGVNIPSVDCGYYLDFGSAPSITSKTIIGICKLFSKAVEDSVIIQYGNSTGGGLRMGIFGLSSSNQYYIYHQLASPEIGVVDNTWINGNYQFVRASYNVAGGTNFYISTTNNLSDYAGTINSTSNYQFGNGCGIGFYANQFGKTSKMSFVEYVIIDGIPSAGELTDYENYLTAKYGV